MAVGDRKAQIERQLGPADGALVPGWLVAALWCVALACPNLVYSGVRFADTLHVVKWTVACVPLIVAVIVAGARLVMGKARLRLDAFGVVLGIMALWCAVHPTVVRLLGTELSSPTGFVHELLCVAAVWAFYVVSARSFPDRALRPLLWLANVNGAVNVAFAELQIRGLNDLAFLEGGPLASLRSLSSIILPTPGHYIGNTAQQNMFGLWMALCVMGSVYLFVAHAREEDGRARPSWLTATNLLLMAVCSWGLWNSTSRSGILSLFVGLVVLVTCLVLLRGRACVARVTAVLLLFAVVLGGAMLVDRERSGELIRKTRDMVEDAWTVGGRIGIWTTTGTMFRMYPMGVGLGQYKWHYLEAQRAAFASRETIEPWYVWQYTHWAHNELFQWACEEGVVGAAMLLALLGLWAWGVLAALVRAARGRGDPLPLTVAWGCALVALILFNALWTRPFHRIENVLWLMLAFAVTCRQALVGRLGWALRLGPGPSRVAGVLAIASALGGAAYLGSALEGNLVLRQALSTRDALLQRHYLERASEHIATREEALRNLGYHWLQLGEQTGDIAVMQRGWDELMGHFQREPSSEDLSALLNWAQRFQLEAVLRELASYLKPGSYALERRPVGGGASDAPLLLVPVHSSGGMQFTELGGERASMDP